MCIPVYVLRYRYTYMHKYKYMCVCMCVYILIILYNGITLQPTRCLWYTIYCIQTCFRVTPRARSLGIAFYPVVQAATREAML